MTSVLSTVREEGMTIFEDSICGREPGDSESYVWEILVHLGQSAPQMEKSR